MKFALIEHSWHPERPTEWMIRIDSYLELFEWFETQSLCRDGMLDYAEHVSKGRHASTTIGAFFEAHKDFGLPVDSVLVRGDLLTNALFRPKVKSLDKYGSILINANGAFRPTGSDIQIIVQQDRDSMDWPNVGGEVRLLRWPGGRHWYAKVGPHDVVVDGAQKWNTPRAAKQAVAAFIAARTA